MGYYTEYQLSIKPADKQAELIAALRAENDNAEYALTENGDFRGEPLKWYEHEKDLRSFSTAHPDAVFCLRGDGEESGDIWVMYAQNGKAYKQKIEVRFDAFDPGKLL